MSTARRAARAAWAIALWGHCVLGTPGARAQAVPVSPPATQWHFERDAFTDLWYHGLAVVGFYGDARVSLYDPSYAGEWAEARGREGFEVTELERGAGTLRAAFESDPAFEILHFVPLYFVGGPDPGGALDALAQLASGRGGPRSSLGPALDGVGTVLAASGQRQALAAFLRALERDRYHVRRSPLGPDASRVRALGAQWSELAAGPIGTFLQAEGLSTGTVRLTAALGIEGRFVDTRTGALVAVGVGRNEPDEAVLGAVLRELCYPAVRRALGPMESDIGDRRTVSDVSDLSATRCAELLLEEHAPSYLPAYRTRFSVTPLAGFLSASGLPSGVVASESAIEAALLRELNLDGRDRSVRTR